MSQVCVTVTEECPECGDTMDPGELVQGETVIGRQGRRVTRTRRVHVFQVTTCRGCGLQKQGHPPGHVS